MMREVEPHGPRPRHRHVPSDGGDILPSRPLFHHLAAHGQRPWRNGGIVRGMALGLLAVSLSGCAVFLLGAGATAGYAVSKDSVKNTLDLPLDTVFRQSLSVTRGLGLVTVEDAAHGLIHAKIQDVNVVITIKPVTNKSVELKVQARSQWWLPEIEVAQAVYTKILERLT